MVEYLNSQEVQKPHNVECDDHAARIQALVRRTNQIEGSIPPIGANEEKQILICLFPPH